MAKLFQSRLKIEEQAAVLQPFNPQINQGATTPYIPDSKINQGATTPYVSDSKINQGSVTITKTQITPNQGNIELSPVKNTSPGILTIPRQPNTVFSDRVNLEDRTRQSPLVGTTTGLQQFFLSDFYAGRLPNPHYQFTPNQGGIILQAYLFSPNQGSITISNIGFSANQGTVIITPFSFLPNQGSVTLTNYNFLPNQGTQTLNNNTTSISTILPFDFLPSQGSVVLGPYSFSPFQDANTITVQSLGTSQIQLLQGLTLDTTGNLTSFVIPNLNLANPNQGFTTINIPNFTPSQGSVIINLSNFTPDQGTIQINPIAFVPTQGSTTPDIVYAFNKLVQAISKPTEVHGEANLNILGYELDRLLAKTLPEVKHGSTLGILTLPVSPTEPSPNFRPQYEIPTEERGADVENYIQLANQRMGQPTLRSSDRSNKINLLGTDFSYGTLNDAENIKKNSPYLSNNGTGGKSGERYSADYPQDSAHDFNKDYVTLSFTSIRDDNTIQFRAYITALSDNWGPTYTDVKYVGRQDTLKVFNGTTRTMSIGFKIPSHNIQSLKDMYTRIQQLIRGSVVGKYRSGTPYVVGPSLRATIGNYIVNTPCVATSLKIDTNPSEYPWEIVDQQLPQFLDVSMELFILGDNNGKTLNSNGIFVSIK